MKKKTEVFNKYADFYDLYYADKDYAAEADFILKLARGFKCRPRTMLDMGCGTGRHLAEFQKRGLACDGFDLSPKMLAQAGKRLAGSTAGLSLGNLTTFENGKTYDLVVSMFAVMGYLIENADLLAGLKTACTHLKPGGLLIFDGWFGPAVLAQKPEKRSHEYRTGPQKIVRTVLPELDAIKQIVTANYSVQVSGKGYPAKTTRESHRMRFMFVQEMALALDVAGLQLLHACPFMQDGKQLTTETWNVSFVARKKTRGQINE